MRSSRGFPFVSALVVALSASTAPFGAQGDGTDAQDATPSRVADEDAPAPRDAAELFSFFSELKGLEARFVEEKHLALLVVPLQSAGRLYLLPPGHMTRVVESPQPTTLAISPGKLRMIGPEGEETTDLGANDALRVLVTSLLEVFSGDREELERSYRIDFALDAEAPKLWHLALTPRERPLTEMVKGMRIDGEGRAVKRIEITEPNGDRTVTRILSSNTQRSFSADEKRELFGIVEATQGAGH